MKYIYLPATNRKLTIAQYVEIVRKVKNSPVNSEFNQSFNGWWSNSREEILNQFFIGVQDRINKNMSIRALSEKRLSLIKKKRLKSECRWCGTSLNSYVEQSHARFCDNSCNRDFYM